MQAAFPEHIGRYRILQLLGTGAMGAVFLAEDPRIKRRVAIKTVRWDEIRNEADRKEYLLRFQREAEIVGLLNHPSIVQIYDFGESEVGPFLAMEYIAGRPLDALIEEGGFRNSYHRLKILAQLSEALDFAHRQGIIHRDIKPGNVMMTTDGKPKLMDFGIAKVENAGLTRTGTFLGTPSYASPEQILEGNVDQRSDVFSLAILAYELLTGQTPFPGTTINAILYKIVHEPPYQPERPPDGFRSEGWKRVFSKALAKEPAERYPNCIHFVHDLLHETLGLDQGELRELLGILKVDGEISMPQITSTAHEETLVVAPESRRSFWIWATLVFVVVSGGTAFIFHKPNPAPLPAPVEPQAPPPKLSPANPPEPTESPVPKAESGLVLRGAFPVRMRINGKDRGEWTPGQRLVLEPGPILVELHQSKYFYRESRKIQLPEGQDLDFRLPALAPLTVESFPGSGILHVDGQPTGVETTGEHSVQVSVGRHEIQVGPQGRKEIVEVDRKGLKKKLRM